MIFTLLLALAATVHALQFSFEFDNTAGNSVSPPIVGTGTVTIATDPGDGTFAFTALSPMVSFTFGAVTFTNADILTPLANILVKIATVSSNRVITFGGSNGGPFGGSLDFFQEGNILSFQPDFGSLYFHQGYGDFLGRVGSLSTAIGDPHLTGAGGVMFDFEGVANATYALFVTPVFAINMRLAQVGPKERFITEVGILAGGQATTVGPWSFKAKAHRGELTKLFESVGATVQFRDWTMTLTFCGNHVVAVSSHHTTLPNNHHSVNFLDVSISVPGCHDAFGGALGETYQCGFQLGEWTREREETFRVDSLTTPSGAFSPAAECAAEHEFGTNSVAADIMPGTVDENGVFKWIA